MGASAGGHQESSERHTGRWEIAVAFFLNWAPVILIGLLTFSVKTKVTALIFLAVLIAAFAVRRTIVCARAVEQAPWLLRVSMVFPGVFVLLLFAHLLGKVFIGEHGVDFVIFAQSISSGAYGVATTTMVGLEPVPFLTHHFAPGIYVLGAISRLGIPGYAVGIGA